MTTSRRKPSPATPTTQNEISTNGQTIASSEPSIAKPSSFNKSTSSPNEYSSLRLTSLLLPTSSELALLSILPLTVLLGSLFSHISPQIRSSNYDTSLYSSSSSSSSPLFSPSSETASALPPSYFAQKRNIFNLYFVKIGWFWTTVALAAFGATHPYHRQGVNGTASTIKYSRTVCLAIRYIIATAWWIGVTRWFFGPPLIDRSFRWTGGVCETVINQEASYIGEGHSMGTSPMELHDRSLAGLSREAEILTAAECKAAGGRWRGGHDVSGHVFLLCLSSAVLAFEVLPVLYTKRFKYTPSPTVAFSASEASEASKGTVNANSSPASRLATRFALAVAGLSWWMLLMTSVFFHTWLEKSTGLVTALVAIWSLYVLPRAVRRMFIGMSRS